MQFDLHIGKRIERFSIEILFAKVLLKPFFCMQGLGAELNHIDIKKII